MGVVGSIPTIGSDMTLFPKGSKDMIENIVGLVGAFAVIGIAFHFFDFAAITGAVAGAGWWAPALLVAAKASTLVFAPLSGAPLYPLAGALFGFWWGSLYLIMGDALGSVVSFYIARLFGRRVVERFARGNVPLIDRVLAFMETTRGFFVARVCFIALPEAVTYAAGLTRIPFLTFIAVSTLVGVVPTVILAGAGAWLSVGENLPMALLITAAGLVVTVGGAVYFFYLTRVSAGRGDDQAV